MQPERLLRTADRVSACVEGDAAWDAAVRRGAQLIAPRWPTREWSETLTWSLQTLALFLYILDRHEQLEDPAARAAVAPYMRTDGTEYLHTKDAADAARELFTEHIPRDGGPLSRLVATLTTPPESFEHSGDAPSTWMPDLRMPLMPALEWLGYVGLREGGQAA